MTAAHDTGDARRSGGGRGPVLGDPAPGGPAPGDPTPEDPASGDPAPGDPAPRATYTAPSLIHVAARVFNDRGYDATSMEDLSRAAGISKSSFYHHVSGKEALLRGALERALDELFAILAEPAASGGTPLARLRHIVRRQVEVLAAELAYVTLLLRLRGNTETERWALARRREFDQVMAGLVAEAIEAGELDPTLDAHVAARLLSGTVNSLIEWYRPERVSVPELVAQVERYAFDGLRGPGTE